jgi:putative Mg2+ transporter-C (MgtC) family protein
MNWVDVGDASWRLGLALILSALVGLERFFAEKPAGLRTHMLVGFGSALFMIVAEMTGLDPGRTAAGLITGIGFLGAGTIIRQRGEIQGLTTAASIWTVAGIGIAAARGLWLLAVIATTAVILVLLLLGWLERVIERVRQRRHSG